MVRKCWSSSSGGKTKCSERSVRLAHLETSNLFFLFVWFSYFSKLNVQMCKTIIFIQDYNFKFTIWDNWNWKTDYNIIINKNPDINLQVEQIFQHLLFFLSSHFSFGRFLATIKRSREGIKQINKDEWLINQDDCLKTNF